MKRLWEWLKQETPQANWLIVLLIVWGVSHMSWPGDFIAFAAGFLAMFLFRVAQGLRARERVR